MFGRQKQGRRDLSLKALPGRTRAATISMWDPLTSRISQCKTNSIDVGRLMGACDTSGFEPGRYSDVTFRTRPV